MEGLSIMKETVRLKNLSGKKGGLAPASEVPI
jgi:hypothetical protein